MRSVFTDYFKENLSRINSLTKDSSQVKKDKNIPDNAFAKVLADYDSSIVSSNETNNLTNNKTSQVSDLTNLNPLEKERLHARGDIPETKNISINESFRGGIAPIKNPTASVKRTPIPVKMVSPIVNSTGPSIPGVGEFPKQTAIPQTPKLFSVKHASEEIIERKSYPKAEISNIIKQASMRHGVDPELSMALAHAESSLNPMAVSNDGHSSKGLFQLLDSTAKDMLVMNDIKEEDYDPFNAEVNAHLGVGYLKKLLNSFSKETQVGSYRTFPARSAGELEKLAVAAFNTGEGNVAKAQSRANALGADPSVYSSIEGYLPKITQKHVERIMRLKQSLGNIPS